MEKEFLPYDRSLKLKQLGFDEPCLGYYHVNDGYTKGYAFCYFDKPKFCESDTSVLAPTFLQAFRWYREKYDLHGAVRKRNGNGNIYFEQIFDEDVLQNGPFKTYEEAELACLDKLIEIVEGIKS